MIDAIIVDYLSANKRLVVPEMGAFIKKDGGEVVFVEFLKKDDQVLSGLVSRKMSLPEVSARTAIEDYAVNIKNVIGESGRYTIPGLGHITRENGLYVLTYDPAAVKGASVNIPARPVESIVRDEPAAPAVETPTQVSEPIKPAAAPSAALNEKTEQPQASSQRESIPYRKVPPRPAAAAPPRRQTEATADQVHIPRPEAGAPKRRPAAQQPVNYRSGRKKTDIIMIIAIVAALIAIGSMVFGILVNNDPVINIQPTNPVETVETIDTGESAEEVAGEQ